MLWVGIKRGMRLVKIKGNQGTPTKLVSTWGVQSLLLVLLLIATTRSLPIIKKIKGFFYWDGGKLSFSYWSIIIIIIIILCEDFLITSNFSMLHLRKFLWKQSKVVVKKDESSKILSIFQSFWMWVNNLTFPIFYLLLMMYTLCSSSKYVVT